jgi:hypothetical protein
MNLFISNKFFKAVHASIASMLAMFFLTACYPNNPTQNQKIEILKKELLNRKLTDDTGNPIQLSGLRAFSFACFWSNPSFVQKDCLPIVVEADTVDQAKKNCGKIIKELTDKKIDVGKFSQLSKTAVVLIPAVRQPGYTGGVSAYGLDNFFKTDKPYLFKLGEQS